MKFPDKPTTPEQWQVIAWSTILAMATLGAICMYLAFKATAKEASDARDFRWLGFVLWGLAVAVYTVKRVIEQHLAG